MDVKICNFKNIKRVDLNLEDNKLNFIYGISGSGKTSISLALVTPEDELDKFKTFGEVEDVQVERNQDIQFELFDEKAIERYTIQKTGVGIYDVIYGENEKLSELKEKLAKFLEQEEIKEIKGIIERHKEKIESIKSILSLQLTKTGKISKTGVFKSLAKPEEYTELNPELDASLKSWIKQGQTFISEEKCPFCGQQMAEAIVEKIKEISCELPEELYKVVGIEDKLLEIGIEVDVKKINKIEIQQELRGAIENQLEILEEMNKIYATLNISVNDDKSLAKEIEIPKIEGTISAFTRLGINIVEVIEKLKQGQEGYIVQRTQYNSMLQSEIKSNMRKINEYFKNFGIDYEFEKDNYLFREEKYLLKHVDSEKDSSAFLSTGEKNVIALILFIVSHKKDNIIIDDPASSFDEYRREKILQFICKERYESKNEDEKKTTLILSHDQIFLKFLTLNYMRKEKKIFIGSVFHFENSKECKFIEIKPDDMGSIIEHILNQAKLVEKDFQKILNLRLYFEHLDISSSEYKYLSLMLHSVNKGFQAAQISDEIDRMGINEDEIIAEILKKTGIKLKKSAELNLEINIEKMSVFEELCYVREFLNPSQDKKELNNIVHFNYALSHLLNPYKFNFQSCRAYEILEEQRKTKNLNSLKEDLV